MSDFKLEKEMTPIVHEWLEYRGYIVRPEMVSANNCDLMGCRINQIHALWRINHHQKTPLTCRQMAAMEDDGETKPWMPLASKIVAVELKLSRMSEVVEQAKWHRNYSTQSFIAMPERMAERAISKAKSWGIGVLAVKKDSVAVFYDAPINHIEDKWFYHTIAEVFWRYHRNELKL